MRRWWGTTVVTVAVAAVLALAGACGGSKESMPAHAMQSAKDVAADAGFRAIEMGMVAYMADHGAFPRSVSEVAAAGYVSPWPANPWTQQPMAEGGSPGDYQYQVGADGLSYTLVEHFSNSTKTVTKP